MAINQLRKLKTICQRFQTIMLVTGFALAGSIAFGQPTQMTTFPLENVRLLSSPFLEAQNVDLEYMLKLSPDRLLAPFLREAGLPPKAESYGNWENSGLDGHTGGHYLTALAQMYAATGNAECKKRLDYMVSELARCQEKNGNGYVGAVPGSKEMWAQFKEGNFDAFFKNWVPWYNLHKVFAGLRDCYLLAGNQEAKVVFLKLTDWTDDELKKLDDQQLQRMLSMEHGGMDEVCADAYAFTNDPKYLALAKKFCHLAILDPLEKHEDRLDGLHANTQIPKVVGFARIGDLSKDTSYTSAARFFWQTVVQNRSISIGGNSVREHFNPPGDYTTMLESEEGPETCNSYNMLRLTKLLFLDEVRPEYMDFYERVLYNHILSSQHPGKGGFVYFTPIHPRHYRVYSTASESFWCCVGTGMENHGKYGELIYAHDGNDLFVNLFIPSALAWKERGIKISQTNNFPATAASGLTMEIKSPKEFTVFVRKPEWVTETGFAIQVNGKEVKPTLSANGYAAINRTWHNGDKIMIALPMKTYADYLPDHSAWVSFRKGPVVLAAATDTTNMPGLFADGSRWGHIARGPLYPLAEAPLLVKTSNAVTAAVKPFSKDFEFEIGDLITQQSYKKLKLIPFYKIKDTRYMMYWPITTADSLNLEKAHLTEMDETYTKITIRTIDRVAPGEQQSEKDHQLKFEESTSGVFKNRHWRNAKEYFSYELRSRVKVILLRVTYFANEKNCDFKISYNDTVIASESMTGNGGDKFISKEYMIPESLKKDGPAVIKFIASPGSKTAAVYDIQLLR